MGIEQGTVPDPQVSWRSPGNFFVGVDLGQSTDPTALCILEGYSEVGDPADGPRYFYDVRHLMRFPLGLSYPRMVTDIGTMLTRPPLNGSKVELIIDETGVGRPVGDIFNSHGLKPLRITITAGELRFAKELREAPTLQDELKDFRRHVSEAGRYSFSARDGKHDDLVLAVAIALWRAVKRKARFDGPSKKPRVLYGYEHAKRHLRNG
jgi:hypothetical protein